MPDAPAKPPSCHEVPWPVPDRSEVLIREVNHGRRRIKRNKAAPCRSVSDVHRQRRPAANESAQAATTGLVMGYYDGNTVTALWNYAQHYPVSENSYGTTYGPSTIGAINLISGQTNASLTTQMHRCTRRGRQRWTHRFQRHRSRRRYLLYHYRRNLQHDRHQYRRSSQCSQRLLGMVRGWFRYHRHQSQRFHWM